jgi:hypothetical protein
VLVRGSIKSVTYGILHVLGLEKTRNPLSQFSEILDLREITTIHLKKKAKSKRQK